MDFAITITGTTPLLMHNSRLADPLDPFTRELAKVSAKVKKTEDDHREMGRIEFLGGLYFDPEAGPYMPADNIQRSILDGARLTKAGKKIERGVFITSDINRLDYDGPRTAEELWADENYHYRKSAKISGRSRVMRTRPMFPSWSTSATGFFDESVIDFDELKTIATTAGSLIGLGDWRPRWGRYTATVRKV